MMDVVVGGGLVWFMKKIEREIAATANATIYREILSCETYLPTYL
jgi:hypothetical protein